MFFHLEYGRNSEMYREKEKKIDDKSDGKRNI